MSAWPGSTQPHFSSTGQSRLFLQPVQLYLELANLPVQLIDQRLMLSSSQLTTPIRQ
jgi:hypothetical protein